LHAIRPALEMPASGASAEPASNFVL
jgi:hypothetical protein